MKWLYYIGGLALYTLFIYLIFWPQIEKSKGTPYWLEEGFRTDTVRVPYAVVESKLVPYPVEMPPQIVIEYDTIVKQRNIIEYIDREDSTHKEISIPSYYGKYPFLIAGDFSREAIQLTLGDTLGNIRTEVYPTQYSDYKYRYTNKSMSTSKLSTTEYLEKAQKKPFITYDKTFVEYKHDFTQDGKALGISTGVTIKDRLRLTGFGELGINNHPNIYGIKAGIKIF